MFLLYMYLLGFLSCIHCTEVDLSLLNKVKDGENHYKNLILKVSPYGECWKNALHELHLGCKHLTEEIQSRLALSFTNCFLKHSLTIDCYCPQITPISYCLKKCPDQVFSTYTEFFTHTQSICHYLQHQIWQEQTEKTVHLLTENAEAVSKKLDEANAAQLKIMKLQQTSYLEQQKLILNGRALSAELQKSRSHAKNVFEDFKSTTNEQKLLIFEVFDRIKSLQGFVLGEFTSIFTFAYYIVGIIIIYILTSVPRTSNARIWLLTILTVNAAFERVLASYSIDEELIKLLPLDSNGPMFVRIWLSRKIASVVSFGVLLYFYLTYQDYNMINNKLLKEIQQQNLDLQTFLQSIKLGEITSTPVGSSKLTSLSTTEIKEISLKKAMDVKYKNSSFIDKENGMKLNGAVRKKEVSSKRTPKRNLRDAGLGSILEKSILQNSLQNQSFEISESGQKRYNLRSRTNSPLQSPYSPTSPKANQEFVIAAKLRFVND